MDNKFKTKEAVKVAYTGSRHTGKIGLVNEIFQLKTVNKTIFYVLDFLDGSTGTEEQHHLEKYNGVIPKYVKSK